MVNGSSAPIGSIAMFPAIVAAVMLAVAFASSPIKANTASPPTPPADGPEVLMVVGEQPGPGMWKVSKGNNVLWIVGSQAPVMQKMRWRAKGIRNVVAQSQEILSTPSVSVSAKQIGYFTALTMLPSALEARKNPDNALLKDIIPADLYARWLRLRDKYIDEYNTDDESKDIERWRPIFAALHLYSQAIKKSGMTNVSPVWTVVTDAAKKHRVKITNVKLEPAITNARAALKDFRANRLADLECFAKTIERIETDLDAMRARANAWAVGDVDKLRRLPPTDQREACQMAMMNTTFAQTLGAQNIPVKMEMHWLATAEAALAKNAVTLAVLPIARLVAADGYLAQLRSKGFTIVEPEAD